MRVASFSEWVALLVFLIVALIAGQQTGQLRVRQQAAVRRQNELALLNRLSFRIASEKSVESTAQFVVTEVARLLGGGRAALYAGGYGSPTATCLASAGPAKASSGEEALVAWVLREGKAIGVPDPTDPVLEGRIVSVDKNDAVPGVTADAAYLPLQAASTLEGVLVAAPAAGELGADEARLLVAVSNLAAASLERQRLADEAAHSEALREADRLKTTLVSSVSHELKTPLAAANARLTGLLEEGEGVDPRRVHDELTAISDDLRRLDASIGDLLDLSRLESDEWRPRLEDYGVGEVLASVVSRLSEEERARVHFSLPADLPLVRADFSQLARALTNLVQNGLAYSPADRPIYVGAEESGDRVKMWVEDRGPGVPESEKELIFEKFSRGSASASAPAGTGLGLAIASEIVRSHGGRLWVEDASPTGARFVVTIPRAAGRTQA